jgi:hypothetical protein
MDGKYWKLHHKFTILGWTVPKNFETDFASIPRFLHSWLPPTGPWGPAAVLHNHLYKTGLVDRKGADQLFLLAMKELGVPKKKRYVIYFAVRCFGWRYWNRRHRPH